MRRHQASAAVYALAASIVLIVALFGYIVYQNRQHDRELRTQSITRQEETNEFFREVCERFELRDEIFLGILQRAQARAQQAGDRELSDAYVRDIIGLQQAQGDCLNRIPKITPPPNPQP